MLDRHRSHIVSTYTTVLQHLADARQIITTGKTPGGGQVAPLPEPLRSEMLGRLDAISAALGSLVCGYVPNWESMSGEVGGPAATRMWLSILLRTVDELVQDIGPERMGKHYGSVGVGEAGALGESAEAVLAAVRDALGTLERS